MIACSTVGTSTGLRRNIKTTYSSTDAYDIEYRYEEGWHKYTYTRNTEELETEEPIISFGIPREYLSKKVRFKRLKNKHKTEKVKSHFSNFQFLPR